MTQYEKDNHDRLEKLAELALKKLLGNDSPLDNEFMEDDVL
jgi:hypothetical protein